MTSSVTFWIEAAMSISRWVNGDSGGRGGPPKSSSNLRRGHRQTLAVVEVAEIQRNEPSSLRSRSLSRIWSTYRGCAVRREPHELVLARVDLETAEVGEGRVEEAEGMGEVELVTEFDLVAAARRRSWRWPTPRRHRG